MKPQILIVGAGAVGQVYARFLQQAGADISFFIKEKYRASLQQGMSLYHFRLRGYRHERLQHYQLISDPAVVGQQRWDQVWLTMASDALRSDLTQQVLLQTGDATIVSIQLDLHDGEYLQQSVSPQRLVQGMVNFLSYQSPLEGYQEPPAGIAWHLFPIAGEFAGEWSRLAPIVDLLDSVGFPIRAVASFERATAPKAALNIPLVAALEVADWRFEQLFKTDLLALGLAAAQEALAIVAVLYDAKDEVLPMKLLARPLLIRQTLRLVDKLTPYDLEAYLRYHFSKVGVQTRLMLQTYQDKGQVLGLPTTAITQLLMQLEATSGA